MKRSCLPGGGVYQLLAAVFVGGAAVCGSRVKRPPHLFRAQHVPKSGVVEVAAAVELDGSLQVHSNWNQTLQYRIVQRHIMPSACAGCCAVGWRVMQDTQSIAANLQGDHPAHILLVLCLLVFLQRLVQSRDVSLVVLQMAVHTQGGNLGVWVPTNLGTDTNTHKHNRLTLLWCSSMSSPPITGSRAE